MPMKNKRPSTVFYLIGIVLLITFATYQIYDYLAFRGKGKRFTAHDGQMLCLRIQKLDRLPCGYE